ncbi:MAG TPA: bifunctional nuclease family protein [Chloroflexia bacterium]|nr:bifunctional nuclease family protein [Chloroflexia bacterium]
MIEAKIHSIRMSLVTQHRVVILKEVNAERYLPIWIGAYEADAIAVELQDVSVSRPLTHDLLRSVIGELGATVQSILVNDLHDDTFFARIVMDVNGRYVEVDSRPSDALALAVRVKAPIFVDDAVMDKAGVLLDGEGNTTPANQNKTGPKTERNKVEDEKLAVFRDFINSLDLDDLGKPNNED